MGIFKLKGCSPLEQSPNKNDAICPFPCPYHGRFSRSCNHDSTFAVSLVLMVQLNAADLTVMGIVEFIAFEAKIRKPYISHSQYELKAYAATKQHQSYFCN